jgi:S1-C subfamily serine protease
MMMRVSLMCASVLSVVIPAAAQAESLRTIFKQVDSAVVVVQSNHKEVVTGPQRRMSSMPGAGSGVLISADGKVMTAAHLVQSADDIAVEFVNGASVKAKILSSDPAADIAMLQLEKVPDGMNAAKLGDSDEAEVGDQVFIVGAPLGLGHTLSVGHIGARHKPNTMYGAMARAEFFQTDAAINEGNSGGPMFSMNGDVIGIVSHIVSKSGGFEGLGFVVTSDMARRLLMDRNPFWTGVEGYLLAGDIARVFNIPQPAGVLVQRVSPKSPAALLGVKPGNLAAVIEGQSFIVGGDIVLEVLGVPIVPDGSSYSVIRERLGKLKSGDPLSVTVLRGGKKTELTVKLP